MDGTKHAGASDMIPGPHPVGATSDVISAVRPVHTTMRDRPWGKGDASMRAVAAVAVATPTQDSRSLDARLCDAGWPATGNDGLATHRELMCGRR